MASEQKTVWSIFPGSTKYFEPGPASFTVNYIVDDPDALLESNANALSPTDLSEVSAMAGDRGSTLPNALIFISGRIALQESVAVRDAARVAVMFMGVRIGDLAVASVTLAVVESVAEAAFTLIRYRVRVIPIVSVIRRSPAPAPGAEERTTTANKNTRPHHNSPDLGQSSACSGGAKAQHNH